MKINVYNASEYLVFSGTPEEFKKFTKNDYTGTLKGMGEALRTITTNTGDIATRY